MKTITQLFRKDLKDFKPYATAARMADISQEIKLPINRIIKLDAGENPYVENLQYKGLLKNVPLYKYPDPLAYDLRETLANYTKMKPNMIACFNGSDEAIDLIIRLFVSPLDEVIINSPTFPMYEFYTKLAGGKIKMVLRNSDLTLNIPNILNSITPKTKIICIDTPGNPTGTITSTSDIEKLLKKDVIVVCDEAYFEYCGQTSQILLSKYSNLIIVRTLSKWAGLAGLRMGYILASQQIVEKLLSIKSPYNVNSLSQIMAITVLKNSKKFLKELNEMTSLRNTFVSKLEEFSQLKVFPSMGAYVVIQPKTNVSALQLFLKSKGILVRPVNQPLIENSLRINICRQKEMEIVLKSFSEFYKE